MKFIILAILILPALLAADELTVTNEAELALNENNTLNSMRMLASSQKLEGRRLRGWIKVTGKDAEGIPNSFKVRNPFKQSIWLNISGKELVMGGGQQLFFEFYDDYLEEWRSLQSLTGTYSIGEKVEIPSGGERLVSLPSSMKENIELLFKNLKIQGNVTCRFSLKYGPLVIDSDKVTCSGQKL